MNKSRDADGQHPAQPWDVYWQGTHENAAHQEGGPQDKLLAAYWTNLFTLEKLLLSQPRVLDLACGNGAVTGFAVSVLSQHVSSCLDYSASAVLELKKRHPASLCAAADVLHTPFADSSFDIVASQFGVEYAGVASLAEAARLVAPGGVLAAVLHLQDGAIYRECEGNLRAVQSIQDCQLMLLAREVFNAGFDLNAKTGTVEAFKQAEKRFTPAVRKLEEIMANGGQDIASGLPRKLYDDIARMYQRMSAYDREDILGWVGGMIAQLEAYAGRMSSMLECALSENDMKQVQQDLVAARLTIETCSKMKMGAKQEEAAWMLECRRS